MTLRIVGHKNAQFLYVIARKCGVRVVKKKRGNNRCITVSVVELDDNNDRPLG